jgi:hypothetical protein
LANAQACGMVFGFPIPRRILTVPQKILRNPGALDRSTSRGSQGCVFLPGSCILYFLSIAGEEIQ